MGNKSSQLHLLLHTIYCKSVERVMGEKVGEKVVPSGREKSKWPWPSRHRRQALCQESYEFLLFASSAGQGMGQLSPKCQALEVARGRIHQGPGRQIQ